MIRSKTIVGYAGLVALAAIWAMAMSMPAQAQGRPDSLRMSCDSARRLVSERGAIVLGTGPDLYDRFVATQGYCQRDEMTHPVWLPTADKSQCFIGYRCKRVDDEIDR